MLTFNIILEISEITGCNNKCLLPASEILPPQLSRTVTWQYEIYLEEVTQDNNGMIIKTMTFLQRYTSTDFFFLGISHAKCFK